MFSLEMILKLTAFGSFNYLRNPYNVFDGIIVIIRQVQYLNILNIQYDFWKNFVA